NIPSSGQDFVNFEANFGMGRYWDVNVTSGSLNGHVNVRFFYPPAEYNVANTAAANWRTANEPAAISAGYTGLAQLTPYWFKTNDASTYAPAPDLDPTTVNSSNILVLNDDFVGTDALPIHNNRNYVQFDNQITGFSGGTAAFRVTPVNILDNSLVQFRGRKQETVNVLNWLVDSEEDIAYYILERSKDAVEFEQLAKLNNTNSLNYQFVDELPFTNSYYRLRLVSLDGSVQHSNMINLSRTGLNEQSINIYPNPTQGNLTVEFDTDLELNANLRILDVLGRTLTQENIEMQVGKNKTVLDLNNLPSAVYIISIETVNQKFIKRITKSK
ncbi:MAG: T9SS type A sorting domain-containing protein, partial [Saprospiraceae bacterium]|nr:T9SS type A sorting domain-containing protein [Saprospiraceae bacterium]